MPVISLVVPIYNVEPYLRACLDSIAAQTVDDFEVIMVDDGSTDGSRAIAEEFAARDGRFRLICQPNAGLGAARNRGAAVVRGEYLAFVDSDDVLPRRAYEMLLEPLQKTGSDFATGNVHRLVSGGSAQSPFLARTFAETRWKTHVTEFRPLIADRIVPNKLWRRSFWGQHGFRFPEGMVHEDIPVVVPAQFAARSVDVVAEPVYFYRIRQGADLSITQQRAQRRSLSDRIAAIEMARDYLIQQGPPEARDWYERSVVADDLSYYLDVLDVADHEYRALFLDRVNALLDQADRRILETLPAIDRLKWHLVRRRLMPELLEVLRFDKERLNDTPPVRIGRRWYGDYPFRTDRRLDIPRSVYRLDREFTLLPRIDSVRFEGDVLRIDGYAFIGGIGAPERGSQRVAVSAVRPGRFQPLLVRIWPSRFRTSPVHRPDVTSRVKQSWCNADWSGFAATLDLRKLRTLARWRAGAWELYITVSASGVRRRRPRFRLGGRRPVRAVERVLTHGMLARAAPTAANGLVIELRDKWARVTGQRLSDAALELTGELSVWSHAAPALRIRGPAGSRNLEYPISADRGGFSVRVPLADLEEQLRRAKSPAPDGQIRWELYVVNGGRVQLTAADELPDRAWPLGGGELVLERGREGDASLVLREPRPLVTDARWADGLLELSGSFGQTTEPWEVVLRSRALLEEHAFPLRADPASGRFDCQLTPAGIPSLAGELPLREGGWGMYARPAGGGREVPVTLGEALYERLPLPTVVSHKQFRLGINAEKQALLFVGRDLDDDERGRFHQRRLRQTAYTRGRERELRDTVVYSSFGGRQYSDSPRAIHEELVRREAPLEHLWVVRDGVCRVPPSATTVREGSREHYEALARARYVVSNDHFPEWFRRRADQTCLQTWHGTPLKRLGLDVPEIRRTARRARRRWAEQVANWQYVLSPNRFSTPILRRAYDIGGEILETGYPRNDILAAPNRDAATDRLRRRLMLPTGARVVLYAPTYRDEVVDRKGRHRLDLHLDLARLQDALGDDTILLFRKHHYVVDPVPADAGGFVRDVSGYPDGTELLLAADVLVTDYSSIMFDFAITGRPMLFFTYDLKTYEDEIRGFYFDFADKAPGPLLRTTDELADALRNIDDVRAQYAGTYSAFAAVFCELDDGRATARVVDRLFSTTEDAAIPHPAYGL